MMGGGSVKMTKDNQITNFLDRYGLLILCVIWLLMALTWADRILFGDEAMMGIAILESGLSPFEPLTQYEQTTTYGLHLLTILTTNIFGYGNIAMRLPILLIFFVVLVLWGYFLKEHYSGLTAFTVTVMMMCNTSLLRYATEFKHYGIEAAFTMLLLMTYLRYRQSKTQQNLIIHVFIAILAVFFGLSTALVVTSIFIYECLSYLYSQLKNETPINAIRSLIMRGWVWGHALYYGLLFLWYVFSIRVVTANYTNYQSLQSSLESLLDPSYWLNTLGQIGWGMFGVVISFPFLLILPIIIYLIVIKRHKNLPFIIFIMVYLLIHALNIAGLYPILSGRHFIFMIPIIYLVFAELFHLLTPRQSIATVASALIVSSVFLNYAVFHRYMDIWDFQLPDDLALIEPTDTVFNYLMGQPTYDWYKMTSDPHLPELSNSIGYESSPIRVTYEELQADFEGNISRPGAWHNVMRLRTVLVDLTYDEYFLEQVISTEHSKIFNYWTMSGYLRNEVAKHCTVTPLTDSWRVWVAEVRCP